MTNIINKTLFLQNDYPVPLVMTDKTIDYLAANLKNHNLIFIGERTDAKEDPAYCASDVYNKRLEDKQKIDKKISDDLKRMIDKFSTLLPKNGTVLDIGCGIGLQVKYLSSLGLQVYGIDISEEAISIARSSYPDLNFVTGNLLDIPISEATKFDGIFERLALMHLPKDIISESVEKAFGHIKPGGLMEVTFEIDNPKYARTGWYLSPWGNFPKDKDGTMTGVCKMAYLSYFSPNELKLLFEEKGFKTVELSIYHEDKTSGRDLMTILVKK